MADHVVGVAIGFRIGAGRHAEIAGFRIDGPQPAIGSRMQPGDVIAHREHLPAGHGVRRNQHCKIGLAAGRRKCRGDVVRLALGALQSDDQHVLGEPALGTGLVAGDAQRMTFLAQQRIAAVTGAEALDEQLFGEVHDEATVRIQFAGRVQSLARICRSGKSAPAPGDPCGS